MKILLSEIVPSIVVVVVVVVVGGFGEIVVSVVIGTSSPQTRTYKSFDVDGSSAMQNYLESL